MIRDTVAPIKDAEPAIREVQMHLFAQPRSDLMPKQCGVRHTPVGVLKLQVRSMAKDPQGKWNCGDGCNGLRRDDTSHQRTVALQLPGQHIGSGRRGDR